MNIKADVGMYLMVWFISSLVFFMCDIECLFRFRTKIFVPIAITVCVAILRISIWFMIGE